MPEVSNQKSDAGRRFCQRLIMCNDEASAMDVYDVTPLARTKGNRIVVALRSPNGVGGLIAAVDVSADYQNLAITDASWHIVKRWAPDLLVRDPAPAFVV